MPLMDEVAEHDLNNDQQQYQQQRQEEEAARRKQIADNFVLQRRRAVGNLLQLAGDIAAGIEDEVEATQVTAEFFERVADMFADGQQLADNFISQAGANQAQVRQLESRTHELEEQLADVQGNQDDLERSAQRASDLQIQVNELDRERLRLEHEVTAMCAQAGELRQQLAAANSDKEAAVESSNAWQSQVESLQQQLAGANTRVTELQEREERALDAATHWRGIAVSLGYVEPDGSDQPDAPEDSTTGTQPARQPYPGGGGIGDEDVTDPLIGGPNGAFSGDQSTAPAADEPQPRRRRSWRRPERHSRRERLTNPDQSSHPEGA